MASCKVTVLLLLFSCVPCSGTDISNTEEDLDRDLRFLLDDVTNHEPDAYVSTGSLTFKNREFYLEGKPFRILSGSIHYFRVVPEYWRDRLLKMKAGGLNTIQIYVPWNLHEEQPGNFRFDGILDIRKFLQLAHELGLKVIFRPGPYICAEWDLGGLPSWLLRDQNMRLRSNYPGYKKRVEMYFQRLMREVVDLQYKRGGPIIAIQVENEFGSFSDEVEHLHFLKQLMMKNGMEELFLTSDGFYNDYDVGMDRVPFYREALPTANFDKIDQGYVLYRKIANLSQDFPLMTTEFWAGWFDQWGGIHHTTDVKDYEKTVRSILNASSSINFYMYHGGTNFAFTAGANWVINTSSYVSDVTSYDYDAPLSEAGDITQKYNVTRKLIETMILGNASLLDPPPNTFKAQYGTVQIREYLDFQQLVQLTDTEIYSQETKPMEEFGQTFGYILYRTNIPHGQNLSFLDRPSDRLQVFLDGMSIGVLDSWRRHRVLNISSIQGGTSQTSLQLDILVENRGRVNYEKMGWNVMSKQRKGLSKGVTLDDQLLYGWRIYPMGFSTTYLQRASKSKGWKHFSAGTSTGLAFFRGYLNINHQPHDTFVLMTGWSKGFVVVNGHNLGRYWNIGPQHTLFLPAPYLKSGQNEIMVFEEHTPHGTITFQSMPSL